jgi:hypothetical protein
MNAVALRAQTRKARRMTGLSCLHARVSVKVRDPVGPTAEDDHGGNRPKNDDRHGFSPLNGASTTPLPASGSL